MKNTLPLVARMLLVYVSLISFPALIQAETVDGHVTKVNGSATLILANGLHERISPQTAIPIGSKIETGPETSLVVQWMPGALSVITSSATVAVNSLTYGYGVKDGLPQRRVGINLVRGCVFSHLDHHNGASDFRIRTPLGVAAARGTDWEVSVNNNGSTTVFVLISAVNFTFPNGIVITVKGGYLLSVDVNGQPVPLTQDEIDLIIYELGLAGVGPGNTIDYVPDNNTLRETPVIPNVPSASH